MALTDEGLKFIMNWEGFRPSVYICAAGYPTIGRGHVVRPHERALYNSKYVMTEEEALRLLKSDLEHYEAAVDEAVKVKLTSRQRDVLVSFCYNTGIAAFRSSTLLRKLNAGEKIAVGGELLRWCKGGQPPKTIEGLRRRRVAERDVWLKEVGGVAKIYRFTRRVAQPLPLDASYVRFAKCG